MKIFNKISTTVAEIFLYGFVGKWLEIDTEKLIQEIEELKKQGVAKLVFYVNSDGGDVVQGQAFWNYLNRNDFEVDYIVDGVAASIMAMMMTNPKHRVIANPYSKFMYHRVQGMVRGNSDEVRSYADMMDKFEVDLIDMFSKRTGIEHKKVKKTYFGNTNVWLTAKEAKELGLVNEIREGREGVSEPKDTTNSKEVYNHFNTQLINCFTNSNTNMKLLAKLLNLNENSSEEAIETAVKNILENNSKLTADLQKKDNKIAELENKAAEQKKEKAKNLAQRGCDEKRYGAEMVAVYQEMALENYDRTEKLINSMAKVGKVVNQLNNNAESTIPEAEKGWTLKDYRKNNRAENLLNTNPERFKELYKAETGKEYKQ